MGHRIAAFIGLNPSTADEVANDPTVKRCIHFARIWGYDGMFMLNIFGLRSTDPGELYNHSDPVGEGNLGWILRRVGESELTVACWGNHGEFRGQGRKVAAHFHNLVALRVTKQGHPYHPLYLPNTIRPVSFIYQPC